MYRIRPTLLALAFGMALLPGCGRETDDTAGELAEIEANEKAWSSANAETLILNARARIGTADAQRCNCKRFVQTVASNALGISIPSTAADNYSWSGVSSASTSTPVRQMAQWLATYANKRYAPGTIAGSTTVSTTASIPNTDPQVVVVYSSNTNTTATLSNGVSSISATSTGGVGGTVSSGTLTGSAGSWSLSVRNGSATSATGVRVVVLSYSRISSDWTTANRGDMLQMYGSFFASGASGPHSTFVQTNGQTGTNWVNANWTPCSVTELATTLTQAIRWFNSSDSAGFTVYRLN